ncbi:MAG: porin family protein [Candidatus Onthomorpha sp.]|nr:porin family protein [Candidatus Onthomorpha sp.]
MKKVMVCLFACLMTLAATECVNAQKVNFGVKAGLNLSTWNYDDASLRPGFHAGGFATVQFSRMFAVQPEVMYSMEGAAWEGKLDAFGFSLANAKVTSTVHKLNVPVMLQFTPISMLTIEAGPQFGFNLAVSHHIKSNIAGIVETEEDMDVDKENYNTFEMGIAAGLKLNLTRNMAIGARYVYGISPIFDEGRLFSRQVTDAVHTSNIMVSLNFAF